MKVRILVQLKPGILDPQGKAVEQGLHGLGFDAKHVRVGRLIEMDLPVADVQEAETRVQSMCDRLLVNPVMERAIIEVKQP